MMDQEKLHFKLELAGTFWDKRPTYSILINDEVIETAQVPAASGESFLVEFDKELTEGPVSLVIRLDNKEYSDVVKDNYDDPDNFVIVKDLLLHIRSINIDDIDLGNIIHSKSIYVPDDKQHPELDHCVDLGWNGAWRLDVASPFYLWLLENI